MTTNTAHSICGGVFLFSFSLLASDLQVGVNTGSQKRWPNITHDRCKTLSFQRCS